MFQRKAVSLSAKNKYVTMKYKEIEDIFSAKRMQKYVLACNGDTRRAMTLYRYNLKLSQEKNKNNHQNICESRKNYIPLQC